MSYVDGSIKTDYVDPVTFSQSRCRFELDGDKMGYLTNMRLLDIGCVSNGAIDYSRGLGALACIKSMRLMDGRSELSALRNPAPYLFFKNSNRSNAVNKSNDSFMKRNSLGMEIRAESNEIARVYASGGADTLADTTNLAYLDLREVFPILNSLEVLPSAMFPNLAIELTFDTTLLNQVLVNITNTIDIQRPVLVVDHIHNEVQVGNVIDELNGSGLTWTEIEWDNTILPAVDTSGAGWAVGDVATQTVANQSLGFRGKVVERLLTCKTILDKTKELNVNAVLGFGAPASSQSQCDWKIQYSLNGRNVLPGFGGATRTNERLALLTDEWGSVTAYPGSNIYQWANSINTVEDEAFAGQSDWDCIRLGARVANLTLNMSRTNNKDTLKAATNASIQINMYGEVMKQIVFSKGRYDISYV